MARRSEGVPVEVDLALDDPAVALRSFDIVPLEEIFAEVVAEGGPSAKGLLAGRTPT